jgi:hypothetical protein
MKFEMQATPKTPYFYINYENGEITFRGRLIPEDPRGWLAQVKPAIELYLKSPKPFTLLDIQLEYINPTSALFDSFLKIFEQHFKDNRSAMLCRWHHEPDDLEMLELAEEYKSFIKLNFEILSDI